jgi:cell division protein FtsL
MKIKIAMLVCAVAAVALAVTLFVTRQKAVEQRQQDAETIVYHSNKWVTTQENLDREVQVGTELNRLLDAQKRALADLTNNYTQTAASLARTESSLATTAAALKTAEELVAERNAKIAQLESQNAALDQQAVDLSTALTNLTTQIEETQRKLATSEGDKAFLEKELKRLLAEKAELERQFNDLVILRSQVAKLREELSISRRFEWIRRGLSAPGEQRGAALLLQGANAPARQPKPPLHYDLNVEVSADGSVRVIPPLTNPPAATNPPAN